jgi:hypothetical protein
VRRLLLLLATIAAVLAAGAAFNSWIDPYGVLYKPGALRDALATDPTCLVSQELVGARYFDFKEDVFRSRPTSTFVVGSSRVLKIQSHAGEDSFANLGFPGISPEMLPPLFRDLARGSAPQTAYLGVEFFWFNPSYSVFDYRPGWTSIARTMLGRSTLRASIDTVRSAPYAFLHRWRREPLGPSCVIGRAGPAISWNVDGSRRYSFELGGDFHPPAQVFSSDLQTLRAGYYRDWHRFESKRVALLDEALGVAERAGWRVVGFAPPDPTRYVRLFATAPETAAYWKRWSTLMPELFRKHGFAWLDLRDVRSVPCAQTAFVDGGYHSTRACSARIRADLDRAAGTLPPP